uniref:MATH domain-containing protein n=1 Tax=Brassica oleracea var. oleracea TaxID=109376 RepID=A0A0D3CXM7_BRAOL
MGSNSSTAALTEVSTIVKHWREHPPSSYSLKIHNFSELEKSTALSDHKYQSRLFTYGGYNWRLIIYPKGNGEDNVRGFISMYVEIDSESLMLFTSPTEIFAEVRFFVYNKKENKYFTIQVNLKRGGGLQQVLPCVTFNNPDNGYIFEGGQCEFGVDVIVAPSLTNWEVLSFTKKYFDPKFSWTIKDFSELKEDVQKSNSFPMGGKEWVLALYPKGALGADGKCGNVVHRTNPGLGLGLPKVYLDKEDALKVEIEFKVVSATKYSFREADPLEKDWVQLTPEN